jgi:hypothetical protein
MFRLLAMAPGVHEGVTMPHLLGYYESVDPDRLAGADDLDGGFHVYRVDDSAVEGRGYLTDVIPPTRDIRVAVAAFCAVVDLPEYIAAVLKESAEGARRRSVSHLN